MLGKVYFWGISLVVLLMVYYQYIITQNYRLFDILETGLQLLLLFGGYAYFFKKRYFKAKNWVTIYKILMGNIILGLIIQILPTSYLHDFSLLNNNLLINIFAYIVSLIFFIPLYLGVYRLGKSSKK